MPSSLDALLAAAKQSLANADALDSSYRAEMDAPVSFPEQFSGDYREDPTGFQETVGNAKTFGRTLLSDVGSTLKGLGETALEPWKLAEGALGAGQDIGNAILHGNAGEGAGVAAEQLTGVPVREIGSEISAGRYPEAAAHAATGLLAGLLFHRLHAGEGERPVARVPDFAGGERNPASVRPEPFGPEPPPPNTERYVAPRQRSLKDLLGSQPQTFEAPAERAPIRVLDLHRNTTDRIPYGAADQMTSPEPAGRLATGTDNSPEGIASSALSDLLQPEPPRRTTLPPDARRLATPDEMGRPAAPAPEPAPSGNFSWDMSDFADQPAGSIVHDMTLDPSGSTVMADQPANLPPLPEGFDQLNAELGDLNDTNPRKPHVTAGEFSNILKGREKFASKHPNASLEPGARDELDRLGLEYNRTQGELGRLRALLNPSAQEAADLPRYQQAARELGSRLRERSAEAGAPPLPPLPDGFEGLNAELGDLNSLQPGSTAPAPPQPTSLADMLRMSLDKQAADKAAASSTPVPPAPGREGHFTLPETNVPDETFAALRDKLGIAPSPLERADRPTGALTEPSGPLTTPAEFPMGDRFTDGIPDDTELHGGLGLAGNTSQMIEDLKTPEGRQKLGALAQAHQAGSLLFSPLTITRILASNTGSALLKSLELSADERSLAPVGRTLKELLNPQMVRDAIDAFHAPEEVSRLGATDSHSGGPFGIATRLVGAADRPFRNAMERAGFNSEDALTVTQQRQPITDWGRNLVSFQQRHALNRLLFPFVKAGVNSLETGLVEPVQSVGKILSGEAAGRDYVKPAAAVGTTVAGYEGGKALEDAKAPYWLKRLLLGATGLYEIPAELALAAHDAKTPEDFAKEAVRNIPIVGTGIDPSPINQVHRLVPRALNPDYWTGTKRVTHNFWERLQAQIPGLAQRLRAKRAARASR